MQKGARIMMEMATPAKPSAPKAITTKHLAYALAEQHQIAKKQSLEMVEELIGMITKHLKKGERVKIAGLGILQVRGRAARMGRNPATGAAIHIKASFPRQQRPEGGNLIVCRLGDSRLCPATARSSSAI
jgi:DNA-binding protein HU-beta